MSTNRDRIRCYTCNEYDHFAQECPNNNAPSRSIHGTEDSLLRMSDNDPACTLNYTDGEEFDLDLKM